MNYLAVNSRFGASLIVGSYIKTAIVGKGYKRKNRKKEQKEKKN
jgi:hypothetical protein